MASNTDSQRHTRAATRAGVYPPPPPIFPELSFGDIQAVSRYPPSASRAGDYSMELPPLKGEVDFGTPEKTSVPAEKGDDDGGWTTITRKTPRSHREHSRSSRGSRGSAPSESGNSDSESTIARATDELSAENALILARHYETYAAQLRADVERKTAPLTTEGRDNVRSDVQEHRGVTPVPEA
ncbi:hypothetical protein B0H14DRAFT_2584916 [Mycena olivaceomarginata]|nr:hypothetical protein B0H14DRAFT_2584916 [Mycena olivaceomarginata]